MALASLDEKGKFLAEGIEGLADVMLRITGYVMNFAPIAVFAAIAATITTQGIGVLVTYGEFMLYFYISLALLWGILVFAGYAVVGSAITRLLNLIKEPFVLAFSTASSEAAYPKTLSNLERFGIPNRITSFVLPMGYSFNLDGSMMYCTCDEQRRAGDTSCRDRSDPDACGRFGSGLDRRRLHARAGCAELDHRDPASGPRGRILVPQCVI